MKKKIFGVFFVCGAAVISGCAKQTPTSSSPSATVQVAKGMTLRLKSDAFADNAPIPAKYTCDGNDISPQLIWSDVPKDAKSLALICQDPDAPDGTFTHWIVYNIPPTTLNLVEDQPKTGDAPHKIKQGKNNFGRLGYNGPCPPPGKLHHYRFQLFALDTEVSLKSGATMSELETAIGTHKIATAEYTGTYQK